MSQLIFKAKLLDILTSVGDKGELKMRLVFKSQKYDKGVHGDIRHLEKRRNIKKGNYYVHGDIRHLEMTNRSQRLS